MSRSLELRRLAALGILLLSSDLAAHAQSVMAPGTPAGCLQNAGNGELACGSGATASPGTGATAIGINAKASADAAMGFGFNANASSISAMAFGKDASATNQGSVAIGQESSSTGMASTALGFAGRALANETVAVGDTATASARVSGASRVRSKEPVKPLTRPEREELCERVRKMHRAVRGPTEHESWDAYVKRAVSTYGSPRTLVRALVDELETNSGAERHPECDRTVELDDRGGRDLRERFIERRDQRPDHAS